MTLALHKKQTDGRRICASIIALFIVFACIGKSIDRADAHTLLPPALMEYMQSHPDATREEIEAFMDSHPDMYGGNAEDKVSIIEQAKNPGLNGFWRIVWDFLVLGIEHILSGLDHILFVLSLVLFFTTMRDILKLISMFTVAHSITLILAGSDLLRVSSTVVEPMIALSIAYVALTSVFLRRIPFFASRRNKMLSVFGFGLFHGMGFAGLLQELSIPPGSFLPALISFNVGIEAGQIFLLSLALPFVYAFRQKKWYPQAMRLFAIVISCVALFWVLQRLFGNG